MFLIWTHHNRQHYCWILLECWRLLWEQQIHVMILEQARRLVGHVEGTQVCTIATFWPDAGEYPPAPPPPPPCPLPSLACAAATQACDPCTHPPRVWHACSLPPRPPTPPPPQTPGLASLCQLLVNPVSMWSPTCTIPGWLGTMPGTVNGMTDQSCCYRTSG